jgi:ribonuclease Y
MAAELGLNVKLAKRAGLLHDIGKVPDAEWFTSRFIRMQWAEIWWKEGFVTLLGTPRWDRNDHYYQLSKFVMLYQEQDQEHRQVDSYIQRLKDLEEVAYGFSGEKCMRNSSG